MARHARINVPFGIYHIISRILRGEHLIAGAEERLQYLHLLGRVMEKTDARILAWCLMSNHVHLVVRAGRDPLSRLMKPLHSGFGVWLAARIGKRGPVFADRYRSILVEEDAYLFQLIRYVHNNPVRAGAAADAADSIWSSHRAYLGIEQCPQWLKAGYVLGMFSSDPDEARRLFAQYVMEGKNEARRPDLCGEGLKNMGRQIQAGMGDGWRVSGPIVGSEAFACKVLSDIAEIDGAGGNTFSINDIPPIERPALTDLISVTASVLGLEPWEFEQQPKRRMPALARRIIAYLWIQRYKQPQMDIVRHFCQSTSTVSRWFSKAVSEINEIDALCDTVVSKLPGSKKASRKKTQKQDRRTRYNLQLEEE